MKIVLHTGGAIALSLGIAALTFGAVRASLSHPAEPALPVSESMTQAGLDLQIAPLSLASGAKRDYIVTVPPAGGRAFALDLEARMDGKPIGSMNFLEIKVNGVAVEIARDRLQSRLRNKPPKFPTKAYGEMCWGEASTAWRVVYAPDFSDADKGEYGPEAYHYVIDLSDLLQPGENTISIRRYPFTNEVPLVIRNVRLTPTPASQTRAGYRIPGPAQTPAFSASAGDGGIALAIGAQNLAVRSTFLGPDGIEWVGLANVVRFKGGWTAERHQGAISITRRVEVTAGRARVTDTLTNHGATDAGFIVTHELRAPGKLATVALCGNADPLVYEEHRPERPTVYVPLGAAHVTLITEDDIFRAQARQFCSKDDRGGGLRTEQRVVPAGTSVALVWSCYALPGDDEFDVVNRIRRDWKMPAVTVEAPIWWGFEPEEINNASDADVREWVTRTGIRTVCMRGGWVDSLKRKPTNEVVGFGTGTAGTEFADYRRRIALASLKIHRLCPAMKVMTYNHFFLQCPTGLEDYPDSWITGAGGVRHRTEWGEAVEAVGVYPTPINTFGKAFRDLLDAQKGELHLNGYYFDEPNMPSFLHEKGWLNYSVWDGGSAILNPRTRRIAAKVGYTNLVSAPYIARMVEDLHERGDAVILNGAPTTMQANQNPYTLRFAEADQKPQWGTFIHFTTPLGYRWFKPDYSVADVRKYLDNGIALYCIAPTDKLALVKHFYPLTVRDLHRGYVQARERVIVSQSGDYGWANESFRYRIWAWDKSGNSSAPSDPVWRDGKGLVTVPVPDGGVAVLERNP